MAYSCMRWQHQPLRSQHTVVGTSLKPAAHAQALLVLLEAWQVRFVLTRVGQVKGCMHWWHERCRQCTAVHNPLSLLRMHMRWCHHGRYTSCWPQLYRV
jgi:hypothetical protein